jgi:hypothetical protein
MLEEAAEYAEIVQAWNADLAAGEAASTYRDFCTFILGEYRVRYTPARTEGPSNA